MIVILIIIKTLLQEMEIEIKMYKAFAVCVRSNDGFKLFSCRSRTVRKKEPVSFAYKIILWWQMTVVRVNALTCITVFTMRDICTRQIDCNDFGNSFVRIYPAYLYSSQLNRVRMYTLQYNIITAIEVLWTRDIRKWTMKQHVWLHCGCTNERIKMYFIQMLLGVEFHCCIRTMCIMLSTTYIIMYLKKNTLYRILILQ